MTTATPDSNPLFDFVRRRWAACLVVTLLAGVGAALYAVRSGQVTWTASGVMLYNRSMLGAPHYQQPEVQSIVGLFRSRNVLESLARELNVSHLKSLADSVTAEVVMGSNTIQLSMRGDDPQRTQSALDRLMRLVIERAASLRTSAVTQVLAGLDRHLTAARAEADDAYDALNRFHAKHRIATTVDDDLEQLQDDVAAVARAAELDRPTSRDPEEELQRRRTALQDGLERRREAIAFESQLALKKNEYERAERLHAKRYISDAEFRRIETEYQTLVAQNAEALRRWSERIAELDQSLTQQLGSNDAATAKARSPEEVAAAARMQSFLTQRRAELERLSGLRPEADRLQQSLAAAQEEVRRVTTLIASYAELHDAPYGDLTIVQPAAPALDPVTSNTKKLFVGAWLGGLVLLMIPLLLWDLLAARGKRPAVAVGGGLTTLPRIAAADEFPGDRDAARREVVRTLALRLQQARTEHGIAAVLNSLDEVESPLEAAIAAAECLHHRGEHVLLIELTSQAEATQRLTAYADSSRPAEHDVVADWIGSTSAPAVESAVAVIAKPRTHKLSANGDSVGLAELLTDVETSLADVVRRGETFDVLTVGASPLPDEAFARRRLTEIIQECRRKYGVVMFVGPGVRRGVDLEMLAARVDALAFVGRCGRSPTPAAERAVAHLISLRAPVLGAVYL